LLIFKPDLKVFLPQTYFQLICFTQIKHHTCVKNIDRITHRFLDFTLMNIALRINSFSKRKRKTHTYIHVCMYVFGKLKGFSLMFINRFFIYAVEPLYHSASGKCQKFAVTFLDLKDLFFFCFALPTRKRNLPSPILICNYRCFLNYFYIKIIFFYF
jgi:hypothetical protein